MNSDINERFKYAFAIAFLLFLADSVINCLFLRYSNWFLISFVNSLSWGVAFFINYELSTDTKINIVLFVFFISAFILGVMLKIELWFFWTGKITLPFIMVFLFWRE